MLKRKHIFFSVGLAAIATRAVFAAFFARSLFRFYHLLRGLDMETLLRYSQWGGEDYPMPPFFTFHRIMIYIFWKLNMHEHNVALIYSAQAISGILAALAVTDITLMLTGKRRSALICGIFYAIYMPFMVYEFSVLKETFAINSFLFAVWALLRMRKNHFNWKWTLAAGVLFGISLLGRPAAILLLPTFPAVIWLYCRKKKIRKKSTLLYLAGIAAILLTASVFNTVFGWRAGPFYDVIKYTNQSNAAESAAAAAAATATAAPVKPSLFLTLRNAVKRVPQLFSAREVPENVNIYFWKEKIPDLAIFPGPEWLLPLALFGFGVLLASGRFRNREFLLVYVVLLLALPLCARTVIGRYRLMLCPFLIIIAVMGIRHFFTLRGIRKLALPALVGGSAALLSLRGLEPEKRLHPTDYLNWANANEIHYTTKDSRTRNAFYTYWQKSGFKNSKAFYEVQRVAMQSGDEELAIKTIKEAMALQAVEPNLFFYCCALIHARHNDAPGVWMFLSQIREPQKLPADIQGEYRKMRDITVLIMQNMQKQGLNIKPKRIIL